MIIYFLLIIIWILLSVNIYDFIYDKYVIG